MSDDCDEPRTNAEDVLAEIGASLSIEASAGFSARVRSRVAERASRATGWAGGWWALGLVAGVVVIVIVAGRIGPQRTSPVAETTGPASVGTRAVESQERTSIAPALTATPGRVATAPAPRVGVVARSAPANGVPQPAVREILPAGPDLVVLTNQPAVLRRMWAGLAGGVVEAVGADRSSSWPSNEGEAQIAITELTVAPIVIPDVTAQTAPVSGAGGGGVRRVISAEQSARSR